MPEPVENFSEKQARGFQRKIKFKHPKPDIAKKKRDPRAGKRSGLTLWKWLQVAFLSNELSPKKMTDRDIMEAMKQEFPRTREEKWWKNDTRRSINRMRMQYMRGYYTNGHRPQHVSFRWDAQGRRVDFRTGNRLLTRAEYDAHIKRWDEYWAEKQAQQEQMVDEILAEFDDIDNPSSEDSGQIAGG